MVNFRNYFDNVLESLDYKVNRDGFYEGVASTIFNRSYFLSYSFPNIERAGHNVATYDASVEIDFFFDGFRHTEEAIDKGLDSVNQAMLNLLDQKNVYDFNQVVDNMGITSINPSTINIRSLNVNDRSIVITLSMGIKFNYETCVNHA